MAAPSYTRIELTPTPIATPSPTYHPHFASPDADIALRSLEGTLYRVHSYILRTTSGLFDTMFHLPQPRRCISAAEKRPKNEPETVEIPVFEPDFVLERLLALLCGLPVPKWDTYDDVERVLTVAEKWDTPGPITSIRSALTSPHFLTSDPLRLYALAKHFEWDEEAKLASTQTLRLNLHDPSHAPALSRLSSKDLLPLYNLHRKRRDQFRTLIDSPERFAAGNRYVDLLPPLHNN